MYQMVTISASYQNQLGFVEDVTRNVSVFFQFTVSSMSEDSCLHISNAKADPGILHSKFR